MKVVINTCYGGFSVPDEVINEWIRLNLHTQEISECGWCSGSDPEIRTDPILVDWVERHEGVRFNFAKLKVVEIPDDVEWEIEEYDGVEWVSEKHRTWH